MKKYILILALLISIFSYGQYHKTRDSLQINKINQKTTIPNILSLENNNVVGFISFADFVTQLQNAGIGGGGGSNPLSFNLPLSITNDVVSMTQAGLAQNGWLSSVDFETFNNKVSFPGFSNLLTDYGFTDNSANWDIAYGWEDHSTQGYLTSETDPIYLASQSANIGVNDITNLGNLSGINTGDQNLNDHFSISADYTTIVADQDRKGIVTNGNITLYDGASNEIGVEFQMYIFNSKGADVTFTLGAGQSTKQYGTGAIPNLIDGYYAYLELVADNVWSIEVDGLSSGGGGDAYLASTQTFTGVNRFTQPVEIEADLDLVGIGYINSTSGVTLRVAGNNTFRTHIVENNSYTHLRPSTSNSWDLGGVGAEWAAGFFLGAVTGRTDQTIVAPSTYEFLTKEYFDANNSGGGGVDRTENPNTAITIAPTDYGTVIYCTAPTAVTVTIPDTLAGVDGQTFSIVQKGAGTVTIVVSGTSTINGGASNIVIDGVYGTVQFIQMGIDTDDWHALGKIQ